MPESVVDALELIKVEIKDGKLRAALYPAQLMFELLTEQDPVRELSQRIVMGQTCNACLSALSLRNILMRSNPSPRNKRLVHDLNPTSVDRLDDELCRAALC